jgi:peptidoglycan/LPS O-acetylase OafA/YrhL
LIGLDLLRFLAVLLVIGRHMETPPTDWQSPLRPIVNAWNMYGGLGVDVFFVLSGFLVSGLLFAEYQRRGDISIKRFYVRRAWKIYPSFYVLIVFSYFYQLFAVGFRMRDKSVLAEMFFLQSYLPGFWNHTWTLAVEEHFYILMPLLLLYLARRGRGSANPFRAIPWLVLASSAGFLGVRAINWIVRDEYRYIKHVFATHLRLDSLFFGVLIAYAYHFHGERFRRAFRPWRHALIGLGVLLLAGMGLSPWGVTLWYVHTLGFSQMYLGAAALLVGVLMCKIPENWATRWLAAVGAYSYSIYLWHMALMYWAVPHLQQALSWQQRTAFYTLGAFVIGIAMAKLVELPTLRLRDRWYPAQARAAVAAPPSATILGPAQAA